MKKPMENSNQTSSGEKKKEVELPKGTSLREFFEYGAKKGEITNLRITRRD